MMKRALVVFVLALLTVNCGLRLSQYEDAKYENPVYISGLVDDRIDSVERERYGLFPNIEGFISAALYEHPSGWKWEILTEKQRLVAVNRDSAAVLILADYIERHEEIVTSKMEFESKWNIVDYDVLGLAITQREVVDAMERVRSGRNSYAAGLIGLGCISGASLGCLAGYSARDGGIFTNDEYDYNDLPLAAIGTGIGVGSALGVIVALSMKKITPEEAENIIKIEREPVVVK